MKKSLLFGAFMCAAGVAFAMEPQIIDNMMVLGVSPNGEWCVGQSGEFSLKIKNLVTGKTYDYEVSDMNAYNVGSGNMVSNDGIVVGSIDNTEPYYWKDGVWTALKSLVPGTISSVNGITPDGSVICGNLGQVAISIDATEIMAVPAVWYQNPDGTYGDPVLLPHPSVDFTGRLPQYVTCVSISDDGKTIVGQLQDYSGFVTQPIVYRREGNGEWTYNYIHPELTNPKNIEFPEYPGEFDETVQPQDYMSADELAQYEAAVDEYYQKEEENVYPEETSFMSNSEYIRYQEDFEKFLNDEGDMPDPQDYLTEEEKAEFQAAVDKYYENVNNNIYPEYVDFMSDENKAKYLAAKEENENAYDEWAPKYQAFEEAFNECLESCYTYIFNNFRLSPDGKIAVTTREATVPDDDPMAWMPFKTVYYPIIFDLDGTGYHEVTAAEDIVISYVSEDYTVLGSYYSNETPRLAYIIPRAGTECMPIEDYIEVTGPEYASWMKANMTHEVLVGFDEENDWEPIFKNMIVSGIPTSTPDLAFIATGAENVWDYDETGIDYYTYIIPTGLAGVQNVADDYVTAIKVYAGGNIEFKGEFKSVSVYDMAGAVVYEAKNPAGNVATGLASGVYVVKAVAADGNAIVRKVVF